MKKVMFGKLNQLGENAPTIEIIKNTLGSVLFEYEDTGVFLVKSNRLFIKGRTIITITPNIFTDGDYFVISGEVYSSDLIKIYSRYILQGNANNLISGVTDIYLKIEVLI